MRSSQQETSKTINKEGKIKVEHFSAGLNKINNLQKKQKNKTKTGSAQNVRVKNSNDKSLTRIIDQFQRSFPPMSLKKVSL